MAKPKTNHKAGVVDQCQTPYYAVDPLLPYLRSIQGTGRLVIWEPAAGKGNIARYLTHHGFEVIASDKETQCSGAICRDFLDWHPDHFDLIVTNPPYSQPAKQQFFERCYALGKPFALLVPFETIANKGIQRLVRQYGGEYNILSDRVQFDMPRKGLNGGGAQFPVYWHTWEITRQTVSYWSIVKRDNEQLALFDHYVHSTHPIVQLALMTEGAI